VAQARQDAALNEHLLQPALSFESVAQHLFECVGFADLPIVLNESFFEIFIRKFDLEDCCIGTRADRFAPRECVTSELINGRHTPWWVPPNCIFLFFIYRF